MMGASRKANFSPPARGYTGVGAGRTAANRPAAELGNWSTTYTNSYEVHYCWILCVILCVMFCFATGMTWVSCLLLSHILLSMMLRHH